MYTLQNMAHRAGDTRARVLRSMVSPLLVVVSLLSATAVSCASPTILDPRISSVELFAAGSGTFGFDLLINDGSNNFSKGIFLTSGPGTTVSTEVFHISEGGEVSVFADGLRAAEGLAFGPGGDYGSDLFVSESRYPGIIRLDVAGNRTPFAMNFTAPFGPTDLAFGPGGAFGAQLYAGDNTGDRIVTVDPSGNVTTFATIAKPKPVAFAPSSRYGRDLYSGSFTRTAGGDTMWRVSSSGSVSPFITGLTGLELITFGQGGPAQSDMYFCTVGTLAGDADGGVWTADPTGQVKPFLGNVDATSVVFDTNNVLGGGAYVVDGFPGTTYDWRVWHVTFVPEPGGIVVLGCSGMALLTLALKTRKSLS